MFCWHNVCQDCLKSFIGSGIKRAVQESLVYLVFVRLIFWTYPLDLSINVKFKKHLLHFWRFRTFFTDRFLPGRMWQIPLSPQTTVGLVSRQQPGGNTQPGPDTVCGRSCLTSELLVQLCCAEPSLNHTYVFGTWQEAKFGWSRGHLRCSRCFHTSCRCFFSIGCSQFTQNQLRQPKCNGEKTHGVETAPSIL